MEAHGQRIGDCHEAALAVGLHVVLLAAHVDDDLTSLGSLNAEVGTTLLVDLREVVARHGGLCNEGIGRHFNLLGHVDVRTLGFIAEEACHGLAVAATQLAVAGSIEVQAVGTVRAVVAGDDLTGVDGLRQLVDLLLAAEADALASSLDDVSGKQGNLLGLQL